MATKSKSPAKTGDPEAPPASRKAASPAGDEPILTQARSRSARSRAADDAAPVSEDELKAMIAREAYLRSERRGFQPGHEVEDWLAAEAEIRSMLRSAPPQRH